jgi:hypothetical protein
MSAADKTKLDSVTSGAAVASVAGSLPVLITGTTAAPTVTVNAATTSLPGTLSASDKTKLDSVTSGAAVSAVSGTAPIVSSGGAAPAISISAATTSAPGSMSAAQVTKLDATGTNSDLAVNTAQTYIGSAGLVGYGLANSTYASTPDSAALDIVGDIDMVARASCDDWSTSAITQTFFAKRFVALNDSYRFYSYNSALNILWTEDGSTAKTANSTASVPFADGAMGWVRVTLDVNNGASGNTVTFYTAPDSATEPTSWTQLGAPVVTAGTTSIYSGTSLLEFGSSAGGTNQIVGTLSRAIVRNGIGGTIVCDADFAAAQDDALAFTESSSNAASVSVTTGRYFFGVPNAQWSTSGSQSFSANQTHYMPFEVTAPSSVDMFAAEATVAGTAGTLRVGIFTADANLQPTGTVLAQGTIPYTTGAALYTKQITPVTLQPGVYLIAFNLTTSSTWRRLAGGISPIPQALGANTFSSRIFATQTMTSDYTTGSAWTSKTDGTTPHLHATFLRWKAA